MTVQTTGEVSRSRASRLTQTIASRYKIISMTKVIPSPMRTGRVMSWERMSLMGPQAFVVVGEYEHVGF